MKIISKKYLIISSGFLHQELKFQNFEIRKGFDVMCNEFIEKIGMIFGFLCYYLAEAVCIGLLLALFIWGLFDLLASFISDFPCFRKIRNRKKENKFVCSHSSCIFRNGCPNYYVNILVDNLEKLTLQAVEVKEDE